MSGYSVGGYLKFVISASIAMILVGWFIRNEIDSLKEGILQFFSQGSQTVHQIFKPLDDLPSLIEARKAEIDLQWEKNKMIKDNEVGVHKTDLQDSNNPQWTF